MLLGSMERRRSRRDDALSPDGLARPVQRGHRRPVERRDLDQDIRRLLRQRHVAAFNDPIVTTVP